MALTQKTSEIQGRIVHAAIALFSRQGYHGTSTREIARLADVSEVTIFRYFEHKDEVFWSALQSTFSTMKPRLESLGRFSPSDTPDVVLPEIISLLVDIATFSPELVRLIAIAFLELRGRAEEVCRENLTPLFASICGYLSTNIECGKVRDLNPAIATAAIALTVIAQPELAKLVDGSRYTSVGGRKALDEYSAFWLDVLMPAAN